VGASAVDMAAVEAIVWLDPPISVEGSVAGMSFPVRIEGQQMTLDVPLDGSEQIEHSRTEGHPIPRFATSPLADALAAGTSTSSSVSIGFPKDVLAIEAIRLRWRDDALHERFKEVGAKYDFSTRLRSWLLTVRDWLFAWAGARPGREIRHDPPPVFRLVVRSQSGTDVYTGGGRTGVFVVGERRATAVEWAAALRAASAPRELPLPRKLLAEAILHNAQGEYRHAVIIATSAAEVALSEAAMRGLEHAGRSAKEAKAILKGVNGLIDLYRINAAFPQGLPVSLGRVMTKLARPRNEAAHEGATPSQGVVGEAIGTAKALATIAPLPTPESID
jgi:hypothetical protein